MSFIKCERLSDECYQFYCNLCGVPICTETSDYLAYIQKTGDRPYCFDCEANEAHLHPALFNRYWKYAWFIGVYGQDFDAGVIVQFDEQSGLIADTRFSLNWETVNDAKSDLMGKWVQHYACPVVQNSTGVRENE